jgi:hypothetical protein
VAFWSLKNGYDCNLLIPWESDHIGCFVMQGNLFYLPRQLCHWRFQSLRRKVLRIAERLASVCCYSALRARQVSGLDSFMDSLGRHDASQA